MSTFISQRLKDGHWTAHPAAAIPSSLAFFYCTENFGGSVIAVDATQQTLLDDGCLGQTQLENQQLMLPPEVIDRLDARNLGQIHWLQIKVGWELITPSQFEDVQRQCLDQIPILDADGE